MAEAPRRGLGRGLSALLGDADPPAPVGRSEAGETPRVDAPPAAIPIELLRRNPQQPRIHFGEEELEELAASIRERGVLQPILVRPAPGAPGEWQIVAGERRWRAAQRAGLHQLPAVVRELSDAEVLEIGIVENVQRADLDPLEEGRGYHDLMERFGHTQEEVARIVGKSRSHVANAVRLLSLPMNIQSYILKGRLTAGHARAIMGAPDADKLADQIVAKGLSVRQAEVLGRQAASRPKPASRAAPRPAAASVKDADITAIEEDAGRALGLKVDIDDRGGVGEVRIAYRNLEQLDEVLRRLTGA